ncbi:hypothetical protein D3C73_1563180 [compost metagenome]
MELSYNCEAQAASESTEKSTMTTARIFAASPAWSEEQDPLQSGIRQAEEAELD